MLRLAARRALSTETSRLLYGVPVSQPVRAVLWFCAHEGIPIELKFTVPPKHTRTEEFRQLNPRKKIPVLVEGDFVLAEGAAIGTYLASTHDSKLYPADAKRRAKVHEALSWCGGELRPAATGAVAPLLRSDIKISEKGAAKIRADLEAKCQVFDDVLQRHGGFAAGDALTLADFFVYSELGQLFVGFDRHPGTGEPTWDFGPYPAVRAWLRAMAALPFHDESHEGLIKCGSG
eukprot:CAMPEP_0119268518 /NCGR_PEP_ID=MMETSP1329-20130426/6280_1 /TAXON_ID=114041 /ORGANISM="Genus nov. species nov., Strain RCC1024" /LENGTH=232 /DNA_ID=CAMNT_0007268493 /DNA_START=60 /DNA_END=758 /DNA_ORIENTATION=-